jgi:uncharacterized membrane protein YfhO
MSEKSQHSLSETKRRYRNFAALYAVFVPLVCLILMLLFLGLIGGSCTLYGLAALIFISSLIMGVVSLFGDLAQPSGRYLVYFGILVSIVCGGLTGMICLASLFR